MYFPIQLIEEEANECLRLQGEDLSEHSGHLKEIVQAQIKVYNRGLLVLTIIIIQPIYLIVRCT